MILPTLAEVDEMLKDTQVVANFCLVASIVGADGNDYVQHTCWYTEEPSTEDIATLVTELRTDEEFGVREVVDYLNIYLLDRDDYEQVLTTEGSD